jgi:hypothetical protein
MDTVHLHHLVGACEEQRALFQKTFPDGAPVNEDSVDKALAAGLDIIWLARLLPPPARLQYECMTAAARAARKQTIAAAAAEYKRIAQLAYDRTVETAWAMYVRATALALLPFLKAL